MLKKLFLFSLLFIAVSTFVFSAKKKKAQEPDLAELSETLENYNAELLKTALETADLCYELAMSEFADKDYKDSIKDFKSAFELYQMSENYEVIINKALEIYFDLNNYPEKYEQNFFSLKLDAMMAGIQASEDARLYLASKKEDVMQKALPLYYALVSLCADYGDPKSAFYFSELSRSRGFLDEIGIETGLNLDGITDEQRNKYRELSKQIKSIKQKIAAENEKGKKDEAAVTKYNNELESTNAKLAELEKQILENEPRFEYFKNTDPVDFQEARKWCGNDCAVLEYVIWDGDNTKKINPYCIVISKRKVVCVPLDSEFDFSAASRQFRELITSRKSLEDKELNELSRTLYDKLIAPVLLEIPFRANDLVIVPDGAISFIPFDVLSSDGKQCLGSAYNLSMSPSVSVSMSTAQKDYNFSDKMLGIGNAVYSKEDNGTDRAFTMKFLAAPAASSSSNANSTEKLIKKYVEEEDAGHYFATKQISWCNIPGTGEEIHNIQSTVFGKDLFQIVETTKATEQNIKELSESKKLLEYSVLHFACHGYYDIDYPQMSSIVFGEVSTDVDSRKNQDGYLTLSEAAILNLNADLVNLSACQTGLAKIKKGEGMSGLVRSFFVAGARKVGVTLWCVDDEATCEFMTRMYSKVNNSGLTYQEAYAQVKEEFRKIEKWSAPYYWAAFILYE